MKKSILVALCLGASAFFPLMARDQVLITGSSTVFPFSSKVAEVFGNKTKFKTPNVESTGSGSGIKLFCSGLGEKHPDIANASRRMKDSEVKLCKSNGVKEIVELEIGFDGIVFAQSKNAKEFKLTIEQIFLALADEILDKKGNPVKNPHKTWKDVSPSLPADAIIVYGPPPTSGTRDAFISLVMEAGAEKIPAVKAHKDFKKLAGTVREDGAYIEAGENDNLIVQKLSNNIKALGIFGFSFLEENASSIRGLTIDGVVPTFESILKKDYPVARLMYMYIKKQHTDLVPGLKEFVVEFVSEEAWGDDGYLADIGFIPLDEKSRKQQAQIAATLKVNR